MRKGGSWTAEIASIDRDLEELTGGDFGLKLAEGKAVMEQLQTRIAQQQVGDAVAISRCCAEFGSRRPMHDYQSRTIRTLFGRIAVRFPRFRLCDCESVKPKSANCGALDQRVQNHPQMPWSTGA